MRFLGSKCARNAFAADPAGGAYSYSAPANPLAGFKGATSKGRGGEGREGGIGGRGEESEGTGRGKGRGWREVRPPPLFFTLRRSCIQQTVRIFILKFQINCPLHQLDFLNVLDVVASRICKLLR